jgi:general stress protein 26
MEVTMFMDEQKKHLVQMLRDFETGVLVTKTSDGGFHGRPMEVAKVDDDGGLYFSASLNSPKIAEIDADNTVGVFFQKAKQWVSLSGTAEVLRDRSLIDELWQESWKVWFPEGKQSPEIGIVHVKPTGGEYWDISGERGVRFMFEAVKAYVSGSKPDTRDEGNAKVAM